MKPYLDLWTCRKLGVKKLTRESLEDWQLSRIRETFQWAVGRSPFYAELYQGMKADTWEDFRQLPFTSPADVCARGLEMVCVSQSQISRIVTMQTSGTTGLPKRIYFTQDDQELTTDFFHNGMQLMADASDTVMILMPCRRPGSIGDLLKRGVERFGAKVVAYGLPDGSDYGRILQIMEESGVTCAVALPGHMAELAKRAEAGNYQIPLRTVLLSADYVSAESRHRIQNAWDCRIFEHYGMTEMGLGCAVSCPALEGCHIREADLYLEIIDPKTGEVLPDGQEGEIVFTTLTRKGMPFIRYRTGDRSRFLTEPCVCGSILKRISRVGDRQMAKGQWQEKQQE